MATTTSPAGKSGWLDRVAIALAVVCGIHCLVTPVLLVVLPILATTFWTDSDFHLWMLGLVLPTTALAIFSGCRRHKDKLVASLAVGGLSLLVMATTWEQLSPRSQGNIVSQSPTDHSVLAESCGSCCSLEEIEGEGSIQFAGFSISFPSFLNLLGGLVLSLSHLRNFRLCRSSNCCCG